jgi:uncharacterized protein (DUF2235 family)
MAKRLVLCCDGTWNRPDEIRDGVAAPTNVVKVFFGVADQDSHGMAQVPHYVEGVGTRRFEHIRGGAFGFGLSRNVLEGYRFLVDEYEPGDELFLFGFSRGAYTARSTAGLVRNCGILKREHLDRLDDAYRLYRDPKRDTEPGGIAAELFRKDYSHPDTEIRFVGVWDTVGSLGIPVDGLRLPFLTRRWSFHDTRLSRTVKSAYQALAIDERRGPFKPTLWEQHPDASGQTLEQVWFSGVHSDVGGGYAEPALAEVPLLWMVERARTCGLEFKPDHFVTGDPPNDERRHRGEEIAPDALGKIHESLKGFYLLLPRCVRKLRTNGATVAPSAMRRWDEMPGYRPKNLEEYRSGGGA